MAVALAEPQTPPPESAASRGNISQARERIKFKPNLQTEQQREQFVTDFHTVISSSESTNRDKENFVKAFKSQEKVSKLYIGQLLLEQLEDQVRTTRDEKSIRSYLKVAQMIQLPKECSLDKAERKDIEGLLKELGKIYAEQTTAKLSPVQRGVLAAGAAGSLLGLSGNNPDGRQASYDAAGQMTPASVPDTRSIVPDFNIGVDWSGEEGGLRVPVPSIQTRAPEKTIAQQEDEKLIPNSIRALQNPELNRLHKEGCLDTKEITSGGKKIMVVDYIKKPGVHCDLKFPQVYESYPARDRVQAYATGNEPQIRVNQIDATCAIHSFTMASILARSRANPSETSVVVNPFLYAETDPSLTPEIYNQLQQELLNDPLFRAKYGADLTAQFARSSPINNAIQRTDVTERVFRSIYGAEVNRKIEIAHPMMEPDGRVSFKQSSFSEAEWQTIGQKFSFSVEDDKVYSSKETGNKIFGTWLEKWYKDLNLTAEKNNKSTVPVFSMRYHAEGILHAYVVTGIKEIDGRKYFQMTEGLNGQLSSYLAEKGVKNGDNNTVLMPMDNLFNTGLIEAYSFTVDKPTLVATAPTEQLRRSLAEAARVPERREIPSTSNQFGLRVNSVEAIDKLPPSIGTIRIAGNDTSLNPDGTIMDQDNTYFFENMLNAADKKGLKVVFVYNPKWFPGVKDGELSEADLQKSKEIIDKQMKAILKHPSVSHIEIGNEVDENKPGSKVRFWKGSLADYAKFFKTVTESVQKINKDTGASTELILSSFGDPTGVHNDSDANYTELAKALKDNGVDMSKFLVAGHAYHLDQAQWILGNLQKIFGAKGVIFTEVNVGRGDTPAFQNEFAEMIKLLSKDKSMKTFIHEWKPEMPDDIDYGGGRLALHPDDPRLQIILGAVESELNDYRVAARTPTNAS